METLLTGLRATVLATFVTGLLYPLFITGVAKILFQEQAEGSLIFQHGKVIGSYLLAQKVTDPAFFWYRPSAGDLATVPSLASNLSPASLRFVRAVKTRMSVIGPKAPPELLTTSGSGLDPHISARGALFQIPRIARVRHLSKADQEKLVRLVMKHVEGKTFGILGAERVHVMTLNRALEEQFPHP